MSLPLDALPSQLRRLAHEASRAFGYPAEYVALPGLSVLATAIGDTCALRIAHGWVARPIVWTGVVAPAGSAKTQALALVSAPLHEADRQAAERWREELAQWEEAGHTGPRPERLRHSVSDTTLDRLGMILAGQPDRGLLWAAGELTAIVGGLDRYGTHRGGHDRARALQLWDGAPWSVERVTRDSLYIPRPLVSLTGGITPGRLDALEGGDGLAARILLGWHPGAGIAIQSGELSSAVTAEWDRLVAWLLAGTGSALLHLAPAARPAWRTAQRALARLHARAGERGQEVAGKGPLQLARLALVLHRAAHPTDPETPVGRETIQAATEIVLALVTDAIRHAPVGASLMVDRDTAQVDRGVDRLRGWLRRRPRPWATAREVQRAMVAGARTPAEVGHLLARYQEIYPGTVREERAPGVTRGPAGTVVYLPARDAVRHSQRGKETVSTVSTVSASISAAGAPEFTTPSSGGSGGGGPGGCPC